MNRPGSFLLSTAIAVVAVSLSAEQSRDQRNSDAAFQQLTTLAGEGEAIQDGKPVKERYTVTANGSALLVETRPPNETSTMITMVTVDGESPDRDALLQRWQPATDGEHQSARFAKGSDVFARTNHGSQVIRRVAQHGPHNHPR